jgi:hypothetical protein
MADTGLRTMSSLAGTTILDMDKTKDFSRTMAMPLITFKCSRLSQTLSMIVKWALLPTCCRQVQDGLILRIAVIFLAQLHLMLWYSSLTLNLLEESLFGLREILQ